MNQREFIHNYTEKCRPHFNEDLFVRHDDDLINAMKDVIFSCERDAAFTIKVIDFEVIENYDDINHILWEYEDTVINKGKKTELDENGIPIPAKKSKTSSKKDNQFAFINLKDSDLKLIKVTYFIQITEKKDGLVNDTLTVYIAIPRIVDDFYFRINGNMYSAMYQIVDASTYNNSTKKNAKKQSITLKTTFMPIRVYRYNTNIKDVNGEPINMTYFIGNMFSKSLLIMKYIIAKMGIFGAMDFLHIKGVKIVQDYSDVSLDENYVFPFREDMYVVVNKFMYNSVQIVQSFVYTVIIAMSYIKIGGFEDIFTKETWLRSLGAEFTYKDLDTILEKGDSILNSLEFIYDRGTMNDLKLSMEDKGDIYRILRWMMYEFNALRQKDNLDISTKKVRWAEYIVAMYANKLAKGIYLISDKADKAKIDTMKKALKIAPMYLINTITNKCQLVNYKSCVNDLDSIIALKYTYKGESGIGEKANAIGQEYRAVHPSHLGRVDVDSSSNSDPGVSGTICPLVRLVDGHFDEYEEPSTWETEIARVIDVFNKMESKVEMVKIINDLNLSTKKDRGEEIIKECVDISRDLMYYSTRAQFTSDFINGFDIFGDGLMFFTEE